MPCAGNAHTKGDIGYTSQAIIMWQICQLGATPVLPHRSQGAELLTVLLFSLTNVILREVQVLTFTSCGTWQSKVVKIEIVLAHCCTRCLTLPSSSQLAYCHLAEGDECAAFLGVAFVHVLLVTCARINALCILQAAFTCLCEVAD